MDNNKINILFHSDINSQNIELVLKDWYTKSKRKDTINVNFNFSNVTWCDIFEISLISLWILELIEKGKNIRFISPKNNKVRDFLFNYEFGKFLSQNNIENDLGNKDSTIDELFTLHRFPLKFYNEKNFLDFLGFLGKDKNYNDFFTDIIDFGIVNKAYLKNIILKELGDNVYRHAEGKYANFIMSKKSAKNDNNTESKRKWSETLQRKNSNIEKGFFRKLNGEDFFTIVVSDKGKGIYKKLKKNYEDNVKPNPQEYEVLSYAFEKNSSSRDSKERLGELYEIYSDYNNHFSNNQPKLPPPTGLYVLLNIVREFHGFLYLRSGKSIIAFDFYGNPNNKKVIRNDKIKGLKNLANFSGTQIKMHFPLNIERPRLYFNKQKFLFPETQKEIQYKFIKISDFFVENPDNNSEKKSLGDFFKLVENYYLQNTNKLSGIIVDIEKQKSISTKALYFLIAKLMYSQNKNYSHVLINVQPQVIQTLKDTFQKAEENNYRPIIIFDTNYTRTILGVNKQDEILFNNLFIKEQFNEKDDIEFINRQDHLFVVDDGVALKHKRFSIYKIARINLNKRLEKIITNPENKIFNPSVKVLMPSGAFCKGYFEVFNLVKQPNYRSILKQWFLFLMFEIRPNCIISISSHCNKIVNDIYYEEFNGNSYRAKHYTIESPLNVRFTELNNISMKIGQNDKIIIFTDVIATTKSISNILKHFMHVKEIYLFTIINASKGAQRYLFVSNKKVIINQLVHKELSFYQDRPKGWTDDILLRVDPKTNNLIKRRVKPKESLWSKKFDNSFIEQVIIKNNKFIIGHFSHDDTHLPILFDIPLITQYHGDIIAQLILENIVQKVPNGKQGKVIYLNDKHSLRKIGEYIAQRLFFSIETINNSDIVLIDDFESNEYLSNIIIAIDDAFDSGNNVHRLIDFFSRKKASEIHIYTIIKRGTNYSARKIYNINKYNNIKTTFNYVAEIEIPTYKVDNCPICSKIFDLKQINEIIGDSPNLALLTEYINNEIETIKEQNLESIIDENNNFVRSEENNNPLELSYRYYIQKAIRNFEYRDKIISIIEGYKEMENEVLILFKIVSREKLYTLLNKNIEIQEYKLKFKNSFIEACVYFIQKAIDLNEEELDSVLNVLEQVDNEIFIDKFLSLSKITINSKKLFLVVIKHLYLNKTSVNYTQRVVNVLGQLSNIGSSLSEINNLINELHNNWEKYSSPQKTNIIEYFNNLNTSNHEIIKSVNRLNDLLSTIGSDSRITATSINDFINKIDDFIRYLRELSKFDFQNKEIVQNSEILINKIKQYQSKIKKIIYSNQNRDSNTNKKINIFIKSIYNEIYNKSDHSLLSIFDLCETNIFQLINRLLDLEYPEKANDNIKIERSIPQNKPPIAFGDQNGLEQIFHNIIDNKYKSKDVNKIMLKIEIDELSNTIITYFMDDGKLPKPLVKRNGIPICEQEANRYLGNFILRDIKNNDSFAETGFNTVAIVKLRYTNYEKKEYNPS